MATRCRFLLNLVQKEEIKLKKKTIFKQLLIPMMAIAIALPIVLLVIFTTSYEKEIYTQNGEISSLIAEEISTFMDGAYKLNEELSDNPSILTMDTQEQTPVLAKCVERNSYLDQLYVQGTDGMQTARSAGELADRSARWWFIQMMEDPKPFISKSYYSVATGMPCASVFFPMYQNDEMIGIYAADLKLDFLQELIGKYSNGQDGRVSFVIDGEGVVVAHPDQIQIEEQYNYKDKIRTVSVKDASGNPTKDSDGNIETEQHTLDISKEFENIITQVMEGNSDSTKISEQGKTYYASYTPISLQGNSDSWSLITLQERSAAMSMATRMLIASAVIVLFAMAAAIIIATYLARRLTKPVNLLAGLMQEAAGGDFSILAQENSRDEVGKLAQNYNIMTAKICGALVRMKDFTMDLLHCSDQLQAIETDIVTINEAMQEISEGTSAQTLEVGCVVERMEKLEQRFDELKENSKELMNGAVYTMQSSEEGTKRMQELEEQNRQVEKSVECSYEKMKQLQEHSSQIVDIISTINHISSETGLLALNATIEAARAGEQGRGFAVVAESIGRLSSDSVGATAEIEQMIQQFCSDIDSIVSQIGIVKEITTKQIQAVKKTGDIFLDFKKMTEQTGNSVDKMDQLISEMFEIDQYVVNAAQLITDISKKAEGLSAKVADSLEKELENIQNSAGNVTMVSHAMAKEMEIFKLK